MAGYSKNPRGEGFTAGSPTPKGVMEGEMYFSGTIPKKEFHKYVKYDERDYSLLEEPVTRHNKLKQEALLAKLGLLDPADIDHMVGPKFMGSRRRYLQNFIKERPTALDRIVDKFELWRDNILDWNDKPNSKGKY